MYRPSRKDLLESNSKIIECLANGKVYKEIAAALGMKTRTVKDRVFEMKKVYQCTTSAQLVHIFSVHKDTA